jgi:hypothetical protein
MGSEWSGWDEWEGYAAVIVCGRADKGTARENEKVGQNRKCDDDGEEEVCGRRERERERGGEGHRNNVRELFAKRDSVAQPMWECVIAMRE